MVTLNHVTLIIYLLPRLVMPSRRSEFSSTGRSASRRRLTTLLAAMAIGFGMTSIRPAAGQEAATDRLDELSLASVEAAEAAIRLSRSRLARLLREPLADEPRWRDLAIEPLRRLLTAYPDHPRQAWLRFQRLVIDIQVARRGGLAVLATPDDQRRRLAVLAGLIDAGRELEELQDEVEVEIASSFSRQTNPPDVDRWLALRDAIAAERVGVLLRRGELFPRDSDDYLAAAAEAETAAIAAMGMVRDDSTGSAALRQELLRMRCEALRRIGQPERAADLLDPLLDKPLSDATRALATHIAIDLERWDQAAAHLASELKPELDSRETGETPETDLARLRFLILERQRQPTASASGRREVGDWIDAIGRRGGDFARRRAESLALELLGESIVEVTDERLLLSEAGARFRRGDSIAAAERLANAARQTADPAAARRLAIVAAAAMARDDKSFEAAALLADIARHHAAETGSAELLLQAAILADRAGESERVHRWLQETVATWPATESAMRSRRWLAQRWLAAGRPIDAAISATPVVPLDDSDVAWNEALTLWANALLVDPWVQIDRPIDPDAEASLWRLLRSVDGSERTAAEQNVGLSPNLAAWLLTLFGGPERLATISQDDAEPSLLVRLVALRSGFASSNRTALSDLTIDATMVAGVAGPLRDAAARRLVADGRGTPVAGKSDESRRVLADVILLLTASADGDEASTLAQSAGLARVQALLWLGDPEAAETIADDWLRTIPDDHVDQAALTVASLLGESNAAETLRSGLTRYRAIASRLTPGEPHWHAAQLGAIGLMERLGQTDQARRLAAYILLTRSPDDPAVRQRYRQAAESTP